MVGIERWLRRFGGLVAGMVSPLVVWWVWGQVTPVPVIHDEASYLLQAEIFASGRWTSPAPAMPEFFEQPHVQVEPAVASKYPPGHALMLAPGVLVGFPALMPLLLTAITAALLFHLAVRVANPWVAVLSWAIWLFSPIVLRFQPTYLSELTTTPLVLGSWWALLEWRDRLQGGRAQPWLLALATMIGWGALTRPLTMLAFAIPIGVVVLRDVARTRGWRDLALATAVGMALLAVLPLWSARTTGDWSISPLTKYRLDYLPYDKIGFAVDTTPPRRAATMSKVQIETYDYFLEAHREQTLSRLPLTAARRALALAAGFFQGSRLPLLLVAIAGLFFLTPALRLAVASCLLLFLAHLPYAYWPGWTVYFLETAPVVAVVAALGAWHLAGRLRLSPDRAAGLTAMLAILTTVAGVFGARHWRAEHAGPNGGRLHRQLLHAIKDLPQPAILFVRYSPRIVHNPAIVRNSARPEGEPIWIVHDLGERNQALLRLHPERRSHVLDIDRIVQPASRPPVGGQGAGASSP